MRNLRPGMEHRRERRIRKTNEECDLLLPHVHNIDSLIQIGIGHWMEGPQLLRRFPDAQFFGIDPIEHYLAQAKANGFPGELKLGVALETSGLVVEMRYRRDRTTISEKGWPTVKATSITIDDWLLDRAKGRIFLWMDCEKSEPRALRGAVEILKKTMFVLLEMRAYSARRECSEILKASGFTFVERYGADRLFKRKDK